MRTAEEIIKRYYSGYDINTTYLNGNKVIEIINEARKELLEECAIRVKLKFIELEYNEEKRDFDYQAQIDKESILSLINELK